MSRIALTGIKPTGTPHIGNYLGAIEPGLALAERPDMQAYYFIADYHALTTVRDRDELVRLTREVAATWLAFGLDPERVVIYRQSDVPELFELSWILACMCPKGFMNKAHAYKACVQANEAAGVDPDAGVNMGLYTYPILMAADIVGVDADVVPVGQDQVQHVEIARDIVLRTNHTWGEGTLKLPEAMIRAETAVLPGLDGRKMSKSYDNTIPCFESPKKLRKTVMRITTDSLPPEAPKDPETSLVYRIHAPMLTPSEAEELAARYRAGIAWGEAKQLLYEAIERRVAEPRARYEELMAHPERIDAILAAGAERARDRARPVLARVRDTLGIGARPA